jgi:GNAT superfamily N-acetyltransferase
VKQRPKLILVPGSNFAAKLVLNEDVSCTLQGSERRSRGYALHHRKSRLPIVHLILDIYLRVTHQATSSIGSFMIETEVPVTYRAYQLEDFDPVAELWTRINRELAPSDMRELFERYIETVISGELSQLQGIFSEAKKNAFWVVEANKEIIGTFGIESRGEDITELRRMYLDHGHRGRGIAQCMLKCAELRARELGFTKMILSTGEMQKAAIAFYGKTGYQLVSTEVVEAMSNKTVGAGITRFHFEKLL